MLPPLPSFLPARPEGALEPAQPPPSLIPLHDPTPPSQAGQAGPSRSRLNNSSSSSSLTCAICPELPKYTCPGCSTRTCSAVCSKAHKIQLGCDGKRDPTKFVTLNTFSQGDWGGDYAYLEDGRRKIADWGKDLPTQSTQAPGHGHGNGAGGGSGRGRGGYQPRGGHGGRKRVSPKVEGLRRQLEILGTDVEFMPEGMGRRKLNQSGWNPKTQTLHLTIQLSIPPSLFDPALSESTPADPKIITNPRVLVSTNQTQKDPLPTLSSLLPSPLPSDAESIALVLPFHPSLSNPTPIDILLRKPRPRLFFPPLSLTSPLNEVFKGMSFVEFPTLQVWSTDDWETALKAGSVAVVQPAVEERVMKRKWGEPIPTLEPIPTPERESEPSQSESRLEMNQVAQDTHSTLSLTLTPSFVKQQTVHQEVKKPKVAMASGTGLLALGQYESDSDTDSDDQEREQEQAQEQEQIEEELEVGDTGDVGDMDEDVDIEVTEEDIQMMRALGAAAAADME